ncbi:MAG: cation diffusion facilitator family transporter [Sulfolobales archaeon]|nr:cation diffusion facilitator family transporter [Ignisphaera sp.]MCX8199798.1 cation diffusion facilitator family transporter [Sulfolobales archaeon]
MSFLLNIVLFMLKIIASTATKSTALFIEALRSFTDILNSGLAYIGNRIALSGEEHYTFSRRMYLYVFGFALSITALGSIVTVGFIEGLQALSKPKTVENISFGIAIISVAIVFDFTSALLAFKDAKIYLDKAGYSNPLLKAVFIENVYDVAGESIALVTLFLSKWNSAVDGISSMVLNAMLAIYMVRLAKENIDVLVQRAASPEIIARIVKIALSNPAIRDVNTIKTLTIEPQKYAVFMEVEVDPDLSLSEVEQVINDVKNDVKRFVGGIQYLVIEPRKPDSSPKTYRELLQRLRNR